MLTTLIAIPALGALLVAMLPRGADALAKWAAFAVSIVVAALTLVMAVQFEANGPRFQFTQTYWWIEQFGVHWAVGVDGVALVLIGLSVILVPVVVLASWTDADRSGASESAGEAPPPKRSVKTYFALLLSLEAMIIGVFAANDLFLFYVFFEAMLVPVYFIIGSYGGPQRSYAAVKFLLYSLFGGLLMLAAVIGLYVVANADSFLLSDLARANLDVGTARWLFLGFFIAFAIKAPLVPFHTWLPDSGSEAPIGGAVLLVGVLDKVGTFGFLRYCLPLFPDASRFFAPFVLVLAVAGILYAALLAMGQSDMKRLVSYTSISHFGFIALGIFAFTTEAATGAVLYMINHGIATGLLFLVVGMLIARGGSRQIGDYGGVASRAPLLAGTFLVACLAALALPGTNSFVSEFLVL